MLAAHPRHSLPSRATWPPPADARTVLGLDVPAALYAQLCAAVPQCPCRLSVAEYHLELLAEALGVDVARSERGRRRSPSARRRTKTVA
jgi:hypothetical protein